MILIIQVLTKINMCMYFQEQRLSTKENVERRLARTADELEEEEEGEQEEVESEEEDDDSVPYNPKNLPLGHDGKPIPYWLYKLHGLNITYECEICGGAQYKGPKSFQRHFSVRSSFETILIIDETFSVLFDFFRNGDTHLV